MNRIMVFSIIGIIFFKIRKVMCTINKQEFTVLDDRYFDLQLKVSIANSIVLVVGGATSQMFQLGEIKSSILFITVLVFSVINDVLKKIAVNKKYAQIVKNNN
jgi:hypothetical protein